MTRREKPSWLPRTLVSCLTCGAAGAVADAYDTGGADRGQLTGPEPQEAPTDSSVSRMRHHETLHQDIDLPQEPGRLVSAEGSAEAAAAPAGAAPASAEGLQPAGSSSAVPPYLWEAAALLQPGTAAAVSGVPDEGTTAGPAPAATLEPPTTMQLPPINTKRSPAAHRKQQQQHQASPKPPLPGPSRRGLLLMQSEPVNLLESPTSMSLPNRRLHHLQQQQQQQQEQPSPLQLDFSFPSITSMPDPALLQQALRRPASFQSGVDAPGRRTSFSSVTSDTLLEDVPLRLRPIRTPRYTIKDPSPPSPKALRSASYLLHGPSRDVIRRLNMSRFSGSFDLRRDQGHAQQGGEQHGGSFDLPAPAGFDRSTGYPPRQQQQQRPAAQLDQGALEQRLSGVEEAAAAGGGGAMGLVTEGSGGGSSHSSRIKTSTDYGPTPDPAIPSDFFFPSDWQGSNSSARGSGEEPRPRVSADDQPGAANSSAAAVVALGHAGFSRAGVRPPSSDTLSAAEGVFRMQTSEAGSSSNSSVSRPHQHAHQQQAAVSSPLTQQQLEQMDTDSMVAELASAAALFSRAGFTQPQLKPPHLMTQPQVHPNLGSSHRSLHHGPNHGTFGSSDQQPPPQQQGQGLGGGAHALAPSGVTSDTRDQLPVTPRAGMSSGSFVSTTSQAQGFSSPPRPAAPGTMGFAADSPPQQRSPRSGRLSFDSGVSPGEGVAGVAYARGFRRQQQQQQQRSPRLSFDAHVEPSQDIPGVVYARSMRLASANNSSTSSSPQAPGPAQNGLPGVVQEGGRSNGADAGAVTRSAVQCAADVLGLPGAGTRTPAVQAGGGNGLRYRQHHALQPMIGWSEDWSPSQL